MAGSTRAPLLPFNETINTPSGHKITIKTAVRLIFLFRYIIIEDQDFHAFRMELAQAAVVGEEGARFFLRSRRKDQNVRSPEVMQAAQPRRAAGNRIPRCD